MIPPASPPLLAKQQALIVSAVHLHRTHGENEILLVMDELKLIAGYTQWIHTFPVSPSRPTIPNHPTGWDFTLCCVLNFRSALVSGFVHPFSWSPTLNEHVISDSTVSIL